MRGKDIKRYGYKFEDLYLINTHNGIKEKNIPPINIDDYPSIKSHLDKYWDKISKRNDQGKTPYNLRNCAYMEVFSKQKIVFQELTQGTSFALDEHGAFYISNTGYLITGENLKYLLNILNSKIIEYVFKKFYSTQIGERGIRWLAQHISSLPIPKYNNSKLQKEILNATKYDDIENLICKLYNLTKEEYNYIKNC